MTIFVIGDYHGASIQEFLEAESFTSEDRVFSLGDFDTVEAIDEYLDLRERVGVENVVEVGGNHDKSLLEGNRVTSRTSKTPRELLLELERNSEARDYLESVLEEPYTEFSVGDRKGVLAHAGLTGFVRDPSVSEDMKPFIYRIWDEEHFQDNFDLMGENDYDLMVRGHEHYTEHAMEHKDDGDLVFNLPEPGNKYSLGSEYRHILTNGAIMDGHYMEIDEEEMAVTFKQV